MNKSENWGTAVIISEVFRAHSVFTGLDKKWCPNSNGRKRC